MFVENSYSSSKIFRFLLVLGLFLLSTGAQAQTEQPLVDSTLFDTTVVHETGTSGTSRAGELIEDVLEKGLDGEEDLEEAPAAPSLRKVPDSTVARLKLDKAFAYANDSAYWTEKQVKGKKKPKSSDDQEYNRDREYRTWDFSGLAGIAKIFMILVLVALLGFLIYKLMGNRWPWQHDARLKEVHEEEAAEDLNVDELQAKIKESIEQGKFRLAIRYSYLFTLRRLDEVGKIKLDARSTNHDYVNQMRAHDPTGSFSYLTNVYDYVWYGEFELNGEQFNLVYKDFQNFINTIRR
ncbi:MAG: hypothetical protein ACTHMC_20415 [Pseudobacter sp.]|uniref:hypothetical protein n=1 Tax=Pseudobacter sp. TaxID=2045420 RepID=UPI003F805845